MTARDDYPPRKMTVKQAEQWGAMCDEIDRLRAMCDEDLSYKDLEMHVRETPEGGSHAEVKGVTNPSPQMRMFAALMWHFVLGEDRVEPANYRSTIVENDAPVDAEPQWATAEMSVRPHDPTEWRPIRVYVEVIKPGGKSSHEIREQLEARVRELEAASGKV